MRCRFPRNQSTGPRPPNANTNSNNNHGLPQDLPSPFRWPTSPPNEPVLLDMATLDGAGLLAEFSQPPLASACTETQAPLSASPGRTTSRSTASGPYLETSHRRRGDGKRGSGKSGRSDSTTPSSYRDRRGRDSSTAKAATDPPSTTISSNQPLEKTTPSCSALRPSPSAGLPGGPRPSHRRSSHGHQTGSLRLSPLGSTPLPPIQTQPQAISPDIFQSPGNASSSKRPRMNTQAGEQRRVGSVPLDVISQRDRYPHLKSLRGEDSMRSSSTGGHQPALREFKDLRS